MLNRETKKDYYVIRNPSEKLSFKALENNPNAFLEEIIKYSQQGFLREKYDSCGAAKMGAYTSSKGNEVIIEVRAIPSDQALTKADVCKAHFLLSMIISDLGISIMTFINKYAKSADDGKTFNILREVVPGTGINPEILAELQRRESYIKEGFDFHKNIQKITSNPTEKAADQAAVRSPSPGKMANSLFVPVKSSESSKEEKSAPNMQYDAMFDKATGFDTFKQSYDAHNTTLNVCKFDEKASIQQFLCFLNKTLTREQSKQQDHNWKAHISIHPDDLKEAWSLIYPILEKNACNFKIVNKELVLETIEQFKNARANGSCFGDAATEERRFKSWCRFRDGVQITIYMLPGTEKSYEPMFTEIEEILIKNSMRHREAENERMLGRYTSVRHPGKTEYIPALQATNYHNNEPDPFDDLPTKSKSLGLKKS